MWLTRGRKKVFYLSKRMGGRPRCLYIGTGMEAEQLAAEVEERKRARREASRACASWKAQVTTTENPLDDLCTGLELLATGLLLSLGYHRHDRSAWRRRRHEYCEVPTE